MLLRLDSAHMLEDASVLVFLSCNVLTQECMEDSSGGLGMPCVYPERDTISR